jgi:hypothetical protein
MITRITPPLGAPGIYEIPDEPLRALTGERMDVCAFVGVAPRGPARVPVFPIEWAPQPCDPGRTVRHSVAIAVESWDAYKRLYGAFEGPGLLAYAVASFFENGGVRAHIVRVVHDYEDDVQNAAGVASAQFQRPTPPTWTPLLAEGGLTGKRVFLRARDEGAWGNALKATLSFRTRPSSLAASAFTLTGFAAPRGTQIVAGETLRLDLGSGVRVVRRVSMIDEEWHPDVGVRRLVARFDVPVGITPLGAEIVEGELAIDDGDGRTEQHTKLGLSPEHPRWVAQVLVNESELVFPGEDSTASGSLRTWFEGGALIVDASLPTFNTAAFTGGANRYADIIPDDMYDREWVLGNECPGRGVHALTDVSDVSLVCIADLYSPGPIAPIDAILDEGGAGAEFTECVDVPTMTQAEPPEELDGLRLDPATQLDAIIALQRAVVELADVLQSFIVLLDVPPRLSQPRILYWRTAFDSAYAATYHPWLLVARADDRRDAIVSVNPSAVAAGIIAQREIELGIPHGPANVIAEGVVDVLDRVSGVRHDELHPNAINVYLRERDGVRLTAARTLALSDQSYRQLSVRRLVTMLRRVLYRQMQWTVFEPNNAELRETIVNALEGLLRQLYQQGAFRGDTEKEAFFVRCDAELNPQYVLDQGRLYALVGVAVAEPLEFIVLQIARDGDGTLRVDPTGAEAVNA